MSKRIAIILVIFFFLGVVFQSAVIVDYYSESLNLGFFGGESETGIYYQSLNDNISDRYSKPYEILVRFNNITLILDEDKNPYNDIWNESKSVISEILGRELLESEITWDKACDNPGITISFGSYFPADYIGFILGIDDVSLNDIALDKIMFIPGTEFMTAYIHTENTVFELTDVTPPGLLIEGNFANLTDLLTADINYHNSYRKDIYKQYGSAALKGYYELDIPVSYDIASHMIRLVNFQLPDLINEYYEVAEGIDSGLKDESMKQIAERIKDRLLLKSNNLFETHFDTSDNLFFTNKFNMYGVGTDGWITYRYTPGIEGDDKGGIGEAFINAYDTLNTIYSLSSGNTGDLFVSRIMVNEDSYTFCFDYKYDSKVMIIKDEPHAAVITSTSTRTTEARILLMDEVAVFGGEYVEASYVFDFNGNVDRNNINFPHGSEAYNIYVGYGEFSGNDETMRPVWVFEKITGEKEVYMLLRGDK